MRGTMESEKERDAVSLETGEEWEVVNAGGPSSQSRANTTKKLVRKHRRFSSAPNLPSTAPPPSREIEGATTEVGTTRKLFKKPQIGQGWALLRLPTGTATSRNGVEQNDGKRE